MSELNGRIALVTGAASGIGAAVAADLTAAGARVFCGDTDGQGLDVVVRKLDGATALSLDVREESAWSSAIESIVAAAGRLDIVVNCAGISAAKPIAEMTLAEWRHVFAVNLDGSFLATKYAIRAMGSAGGAVVLVGSASGIRPAAGAAAYSTSKAALRMLAAVAAKECRQSSLPIRINVVSPAGVKTPMWRSMPFFEELVRTTGSEEAAFAAVADSGGAPLSEPAEFARVVRFLVSDSARHITGVELPVDDGFVL